MTSRLSIPPTQAFPPISQEAGGLSTTGFPIGAWILPEGDQHGAALLCQFEPNKNQGRLADIITRDFGVIDDDRAGPEVSARQCSSQAYGKKSTGQEKEREREERKKRKRCINAEDGDAGGGELFAVVTGGVAHGHQKMVR